MQPSAKIVRTNILFFLLLTFGLSAIFYVLIARQGSSQSAGGLYILGLMWCPGIAALLVRGVRRIKEPGIGWRPGKPLYWLLGYLIPIGYSFIAYGLIWLTGIAPFQNKIDANLIGYILFNSLTANIASLGEEIGWRGFLVPQLFQRYGFVATALISGLIWALWHFPLLLTSDYNRGGMGIYSLAMFSLLVLSICFPLTWLRLKSNSLWPAVLLHTSHNIFVLHVFDVLTSPSPLSPYFISETGAGLALITLLLAVFFWQVEKRSPIKRIV
jgi:membrane protease YdiL (CAAX protease family)